MKKEKKAAGGSKGFEEGAIDLKLDQPCSGNV